MSNNEKIRCSWAGNTPLYIDYHDNEWGRPVHDDIKLFEMLILEGMQAGLTWITVLNKREAFREAFDGFDPNKVALYSDGKIQELMANEKIIRNRLKINAAVSNAKLFLSVIEEYGSFDKFIWGYVNYAPIKGHWEKHDDLPSSTPLSDKMSKDLKKMGFKFVGSTIMYAFMQATGMVNDHIAECFLYDHSETYCQINELFNKCGLDKLIEEPKQVTGGLMHKMYLVTTKHNKYAVKEFSSSIMSRNGVIDNITNSELIAIALKEVVPVIAAMQFNGDSLIQLNKQYYMIFDWLEGKSIFPPQITSKNCNQIGQVLGKIHSSHIVIPGIKKETNETETYEWDKYLLLGQETKAEWVGELIQSIDNLKQWNEDSKVACNLLSDHLVLSHTDLDPKNVMWANDQPYVIDWEAAGYVNPYQELLEVLNYWADNGGGELDQEKFEALYHAYISVVGSCQANWKVVLASGYGGMLGWLDYSFKRSLGIEAESIEEKKLGTEQVLVTMEALRQYERQTTVLIEWLEG